MSKPKDTWIAPDVFEVARTVERACQMAKKARFVSIYVDWSGREIERRWLTVSKAVAIAALKDAFEAHARAPDLYRMPTVKTHCVLWPNNCWIGGAL